MDEKEAEARPVMGTIFLVHYVLTFLFVRECIKMSLWTRVITNIFGNEINSVSISHSSLALIKH